MSEHQYYEFLAVDRPLEPEEQQALRRISSRADITATRFANHYDFGDLKADPATLLTTYFDLHVYVANWGQRLFMMRFSADAVRVEAWAPYLRRGELRVRGPYAVLTAETDRDGDSDEWDDGHAWMSGLAPVRAMLLEGDLRPLYLLWLAGLQYEDPDEDDEDAAAPPVPPGLRTLPPALISLAEFLDVDRDLLAAAAEQSAPAPESDERGLAEWIAALPDVEKAALLVRVASGAPGVGSELRRRFRASRPSEAPVAQARTVGELVARADELGRIREEERKRQEAEARRKWEEVERAAREQRIAALAAREGAAWGSVGTFASEKKASAYASAVALLVDLREVAVRAGRTAEFEAHVRRLRSDYATCKSFLARLDAAGLR